MKKEKKTIFIHSLFRTGSTYIWNKFRQNQEYCCYYEPFHQNLSKVTVDNIENLMTKDYQVVNHPNLSNYYLYEYRGLIENQSTGIPFFKKSFSFDEFCHNEENPDLKQYIDYLIMNAGKKVPLFQFNRSALRVKWFKENYPGSLNIYLVRNPRDQWQSYLDLYKKTDFITFFVMDLLIASVNRQKTYFKPLAAYLPLIKYSNENREKQEDFYRIILDSYADDERYLIFYYTWLRCMVENVLDADMVININLLSQKPTYRTYVKDFLLNAAVDGIEFEDAYIKEYTSYTLPEHRMDEIEGLARQMIVQALNENQVNQFFQKITGEDSKFFGFKKDDVYEKRKIKIKYEIQKKSIEKFRKMLFLFARQYFQQKKKNDILKTTLHKQQPRMADIAEQLSEIFSEFNRELNTKEKQLVWRDELLSKKDDLLINMENILEKKLEENDQQFALKHELLEQRFEQSILKERALKKLVQEKDRQLSAKDNLLRKNDELLRQTQREWREKLQEKEQKLKDLASRLSEKETQLKRKDNHIDLIQNSYTYKTGKLLLFPFIKLNQWMKKNKKERADRKSG